MRKIWMSGDFGVVLKTIARGGAAFANGLWATLPLSASNPTSPTSRRGLSRSTSRSPPTPADFFRKYFGPAQVVFSKLDEKGQAASE
jgi:hypothetical protein